MSEHPSNHSDRPLKLLFVSNPVGPLGSGLGGGVELTLGNIARETIRRGNQLQIVAPKRSVLEGFSIKEIPGEYQITAQTQERTTPTLIPSNSVLANMWEYARQVQDEYDLIVNFAYDWLPFYLTPFFNCPIAHLVSMGSLSDAMDGIIEQIAIQFPKTIGVHSRSQAETFRFADRCQCLYNGIDLSLYDFCSEPASQLAWVGRISPEKALEDAVTAVEKSGVALKIFGLIQDKDYWEKIRTDYPKAPIEYVGFLSTRELQQQLGQCRALLVTPRWVEAFGNVAIEALACGVPVIAYRRGGPAEIVRDGETGWLVEPDRVDGLVEAIGKVDKIDRRACRACAETEYSMEALGDRVMAWFRDILIERQG